jgi:endo-1,4-beta-xylanase
VEPWESLVDFAQANGQTIQCFHLVYYIESRWGEWLDSLSVDDKRRLIDTHITQLLTRYRGRVESWNVVNEAFTDDGQMRPYLDGPIQGRMMKNWLHALGEGYIEQSFRTARAADPTAKLFYNDYGLEWDGAGTNGKWKKVLAMARDFRARGVPIDGIGFQAHVQIAYGDPAVERNPEQLAREMAAHFRDLAALGLEVRITEMDVRIDVMLERPLAERLALQARFYKAFLNACLQASNCTGFATWGVTDKYSWLTGPEWGGSPAAAPLPWDANLQPKPAFFSMRDAFLGR